MNVDKTDLEYYEVGGSVRDEILGEEPNDKDYVVIGETEHSMNDRGFEPVFADSFPVFLDEDGDEWALARKERKIGEGYKGFETFTDDVSLEEDLKRRDFTINSMAKDPETGEIIDPYNGRKDLENGVIRHTSDAFREDPVRILRMARFAARFDFKVDKETLDEAYNAAPELKEVPNERIGKEFKKAFKEAKSSSKFMTYLDMAGALERVSPRLADMPYVFAESAARPHHHREGSLWNHSLMVLQELDQLSHNAYHVETRMTERFMALLHDIGKISTAHEDNHGGHDAKGVEIAEKVIKEDLELGNDIARAVKAASKHHMRIHAIPEMNEGKIISMQEEIRNNPAVNRVMLVRLGMADSRGRIPSTFFYDYDKVSRILQHADNVIDEVNAEYAMEKRDAELDDYEGEKIGDMIHQDRAELLRERLQKYDLR